MTTKTKTAAQSRSKGRAPRSAPTPVGVLEIAGALDVGTDTVQKWRLRFAEETVTGLPAFPEPRWTVGGNPAWDLRDVLRWAKRTGRA